ncbi:hypothetical protein G7Z17_g13077 [Cylindrodendrum hubeiense]|uniref:Uncharacterized protein n=1 Tax=Cylindrodendrum hubeiense TaxID=595255 RepID=A0A9P5H0N7_9HYPO|nr:hypothetical protein G7Z17_g13077 [Cylindrodendrum hubeiense]
MAIAPAPLAPRLLSWSLASLRRAYSTTPSTNATPPPNAIPQKTNAPRREPKSQNSSRPLQSQVRDRPPRNKTPRDASTAQSTARKPFEKNRKFDNTEKGQNRNNKMYVPAAAKTFIRGGKLQTTPDVWEFLQGTGIEFDNSKANSLFLAPEHRHIPQTFSCKFTFSKLHIMHPHHLFYLQPRGHPFIEGIKYKYRQKKETQPLWLYFIALNGDTGLVRTLGHRRLAREFWTALQELEDPNMKVTGTIIVTMFDSKKAASSPAVQFGKPLAEAVVRQHKSSVEGERRGGVAKEGVRDGNRTNSRRGPQG